MRLHLGISKDDEKRMRILVDIGATMNTSNLQYHIWVMSQCHEIVDAFLQCGKDTTNDVVHLLFALDLKDVATDVNHG